jgi:iron complex transport system permease protein
MKSIRRILFPFVLIALFLLFLGYGTIYLSPGDICTDIINFVLGETPVDPVKSDLLRYIRLPHAVLAFIIGGGLAVTGAVMQGVMRNPLADPYLLGISSGASLGAVLTIACGISTVFGLSGIGAFAFLGAGLVSLLILFFTSITGKGGSLILILIGFALNALCSAAVSFIVQAMAEPSKTRSIQFWLMGNIMVDDWISIGILVFVLAAGTLYFLSQWRILDLMLVGDELSISLGKNLAFYRKVYIGVTAIMVGAMVYMCGMIGFVGLLIPHMVRLVYGSRHRSLLPLSFLAGGCFLVGADMIGRNLISGVELPIGVTASVCGAPFFVWMLLSGKYGAK